MMIMIQVLQKAYLKLRAESTFGVSFPVTTRVLENMIRLSEAKAKLELRTEVTEQDAEDVVTLLMDSTREAFTTELGVVDMSRKGGTSISKQVGSFTLNILPIILVMIISIIICHQYTINTEYVILCTGESCL
jgi:DNA replicative helicase MCM subunit Mcm2 (Cdc46/Mcm family)